MENKVLAIVNGVEITESDLESAIMRFPRERQSYLNTENGKKQLLEEMIAFELVYNYAKDSGIESEKEYIEILEKTKKEILTQTAISKVMAQVTVTAEEVRDYYNANQQMFADPDMVSAKHILVETKEKAEEIISEINNGLSFEEAAQKHSSCPSNAQGGSLGKFSRGQMVPEFEEVAFNLEIGIVSEPVKTQFGYHLIKVEEKIESLIKEFDEVKSMIENSLLQQRQTFKYSQLNSELKEKYPVEIFNK